MPNDPFILDSYGYLQLKEGKIQEAIGYFKKALEPYVLPIPEATR